jgi:hypothetical protein
MPGERLSMRKIRELLRLRWDSGLSQRAVSVSVGLSQSAVSSYLTRARQAGLSWPLPEGLDDEALELLLFPRPRTCHLIGGPSRTWPGSTGNCGGRM